MTPTENKKSDGNFNYIVTWCSYFAKMKLQYMNFTSAVALFQIIMVIIINNFSKQVNVTKKLGRLGTGIPVAPVWQSCGKPSTKFPHGALVECLIVPHMSSIPSFKTKIFEISKECHFFEILIF